MPESKKEKGSSIARVLEIIEMLSKSERPMAPADIAHYLGIPKPSIHRLLQQLDADGFLQVDLRGLWGPGPRLHGLAWAVLSNQRYKNERLAILRDLAGKVGETCGISIPQGLDMVYADRVQANWPLQIHLPEGSQVPIWCTASGKLYLASFPKPQRDRILGKLPLTRMTRNTLCELEVLKADLELTAERGMGVDNEEFIDGMVACSVPVVDSQGALLACLFVHAPQLRHSAEQLMAFKPLLEEAAADLTSLLQCQGGGPN